MATFGKTTIGGSAESIFGTGTARATGPFSLTENGAVSKVSVYGKWDSSGANGSSLIASIYADNSGAPGALQGTTQATTAVTNVAGWWDLTFASNLNLTTGSYWIAFLHNASGHNFQINFDTVTNAESNATATYPTFPSTWTVASTTSHQLSAYATYTAGGAVAIPMPGFRFGF